MRYVAIDVETPNKKNDRISQLGLAIIDIENRCISGWDEIQCNPETSFDSFNSRISGITKEDVEHCLIFPELWGKVLPYIEDSIIVAHNATFDLNVLHKCFKHYKIPEPSIRYVCTLKMAMKMWPGLRNYHLDSLCGKIGYNMDDHHHAGNDAVAAAQIFLALVDAGYDVEKSIDTFIPPEQRAKENVWWDIGPHHEPPSVSINDLIELVDKISTDGTLTNEELYAIISWLNDHDELADKREFMTIAKMMKSVMADGVIDEQERTELLALFRKIADPVNTAISTREIRLEGSLVCLTGDFSHGTREEMEKLLADRGAIICSSVRKKLDYLFVGSLGSEHWATANYGSKVKKALEWQEKGEKVQIIREADLFNFLGTLV